jgi:hypothetical protein
VNPKEETTTTEAESILEATPGDDRGDISAIVQNVQVEPSVTVLPQVTEPELMRPSEEGVLSATFLQECEKVENSLGGAWQLPVSPKNKKRNQARRARRQTTQRRLADEAVKEEARRERLRAREERRVRRSANPKKPRFLSSEGPVLIQLDEKSNRLRLRKSD